jgi:hypothetical protein
MRSADVVPSIDVIARLDRAIRYAAPPLIVAGACVYWMPAFAGMTTDC